MGAYLESFYHLRDPWALNYHIDEVDEGTRGYFAKIYQVNPLEENWLD